MGQIPCPLFVTQAIGKDGKNDPDGSVFSCFRKLLQNHRNDYTTFASNDKEANLQNQRVRVL